MLLLALTVLVVVAGAACALPRAVVFPVPPVVREPGLSPGSRRHVVRLADGAEVPALSWPAPEGAPTLVYYHGNGEQLADLVPLGELFHGAGVGFFTAEYPGYALARGAGGPSEARLYEGAEAALGFLRERLGVPEARTVLVGHSLGSGVATEMAARGRGGRLVLLSPFTSIGDMAEHLVPWLPGRHLIRDRFESLSKAGRVRVPVLVVHGEGDAIVPVEMGRRLGAAFARGRFVGVRAAGHNDLFSEHRAAVVPLVAAFARGEG
ncbi:MAG TPA: alpha/beta hydrolase [Polyangiaceae bacterium]|nr:alpha/beta hydrolase [Polyangiaceae bacterium]